MLYEVITHLQCSIPALHRDLQKYAPHPIDHHRPHSFHFRIHAVSRAVCCMGSCRNRSILHPYADLTGGYYVVITSYSIHYTKLYEFAEMWALARLKLPCGRLSRLWKLVNKLPCSCPPPSCVSNTIIRSANRNNFV